VSAIDLAMLLEAFDRLDRAAQGVLVALPSQMTAAAERLDHERLAMRAVLQSAARQPRREDRRP
jgi:hypothetical protein